LSRGYQASWDKLMQTIVMRLEDQPPDDDDYRAQHGAHDE
jgi:hypothetical protein